MVRFRIDGALHLQVEADPRISPELSRGPLADRQRLPEQAVIALRLMVAVQHPATQSEPAPTSCLT